MMTRGLYDDELQMFRDAVREADFKKLCFFRWLAEHGKLEHEVFGRPSGDCTEHGVVLEPAGSG